jgi:hypothetical protein
MKTFSNTLKKIVMDPFCFKQFDKAKTNLFIDYDMYEFADKVNQYYLENKETSLKDGYAPFCKHIFMENFSDSHMGYLEITSDNENLIKTGYEARTEKELPVLRRYFPIDKVYK